MISHTAAGLLGLYCMASVAQAAAIYKYTDREGHVTYSNIPVPGAQVINLPGSRPAPRPQRPAAASGSGGFPVIDTATQKQRDGGRTQLLQQELEAEKAALASARQLLDTARQLRPAEENGDPARRQRRLQALSDSVTAHGKNIEALERELAQAPK